MKAKIGDKIKLTDKFESYYGGQTSILPDPFFKKEDVLIVFDEGDHMFANVSDKKEAQSKARVNHARPIDNRSTYVGNLLLAKNNVTSAEEVLKKHTAKIQFLKDELASLEKEVTA